MIYERSRFYHHSEDIFSTNFSRFIEESEKEKLKNLDEDIKIIADKYFDSRFPGWRELVDKYGICVTPKSVFCMRTSVVNPDETLANLSIYSRFITLFGYMYTKDRYPSSYSLVLEKSVQTELEYKFALILRDRYEKLKEFADIYQDIIFRENDKSLTLRDVYDIYPGLIDTWLMVKGEKLWTDEELLTKFKEYEI